MSNLDIMTVASLRDFLKEFQDTWPDQYQVWLELDPKGNQSLPFLGDPEKSVRIDLVKKRLVFLPSCPEDCFKGGN